MGARRAASPATRSPEAPVLHHETSVLNDLDSRPRQGLRSFRMGDSQLEPHDTRLRSKDVRHVRWNVARTMFRLESGRTPVVKRKQFDCGIQLGNDVLDDFMRANVEGSATGQVTFTSFKTLAFYIDCSGGVSPTGLGTPGEVATLDEAKQQIKALTSRIAELQSELCKLNKSTCRPD